MNSKEKFAEIIERRRKNGEKKFTVKRADLSINPLTY
jgi:hypothetical protein